MEFSTIAIRFAIVFFLSMIFGIERQKSHKPIGFGTFIFVAIGACALSIVALELQDNPLVILGAIVTGIGFLGAGALIRTNDKIFGFTTAASIWVLAIFGLVIGIGQYIIGLFIYLLIWIVIIIDKNLEEKGIGSYQKKITINTNKIINEKEIQELMNIKRKLISINIDKKNSKLSLTYLIEGSRDNINSIPQKLFDKPWFESFKFE